jgi:hypothetical protein
VLSVDQQRQTWAEILDEFGQAKVRHFDVLPVTNKFATSTSCKVQREVLGRHFERLVSEIARPTVFSKQTQETYIFFFLAVLTFETVARSLGQPPMAIFVP